MKTIVAGSRSITDILLVYDAIRNSGFEVTELVCGEARGVDILGRWWAEMNGVPIVSFPARWKEDSRLAGYWRNQRMAAYAEALIAVWDGKSVGTPHMIGVAYAAGLKIYVHKTGIKGVGTGKDRE